MRTKTSKTRKLNPETIGTTLQNKVDDMPQPATPNISEESTEPIGKATSGEERKSIAWYERDGKIIWDRMRPATREQFKEIVSRPEVLKALEVKRPEAPVKNLVSDELVKGGYDLLGRLESFLAQRATGASKELADKAMCFDEEDLNTLVSPTVRLINKRGPDWLQRWNEEAEFGIAFTSVQLSKFAMLRAIVNKDAKAKRNAPTKPDIIYEPQRPEPETPTPPAPAPEPEATKNIDVENLEESDTVEK